MLSLNKIKIVLLLLLVISALPIKNFNVCFAEKPSKKFDISKVRRAVRKGIVTNETKKSEAPKAPGLAGTVARMAIALVIILLLLVVVVYFFKQFLYRGINSSSPNGLIDVLETTNIMPGKTLSFVRVSDKVLLLGISQDNIKSLCEFQGQEALDIIKSVNKEKTINQFSESLSGFINKFKENKNEV